jgi:hypothetical protein
VNKVDDTYPTGAPDDWTWPENRIDQWGISDKDFAGLRTAEEAFRFRREWQPAPINELTAPIMRYVSFRRPDGTAQLWPHRWRCGDDLAGTTPASSAGRRCAGLAGRWRPFKVHVCGCCRHPQSGQDPAWASTMPPTWRKPGVSRKSIPPSSPAGDTLIADGQPMVRPPESIRFDYEGELAIIIGKAGAASRPTTPGTISRAMRPSTMARYAIGSGTTSSSRRARTGLPPAPLALPWSRPMKSRIWAPSRPDRLNGELVQDQPISDMIWDIPTVIAYCSTFTRPEPRRRHRHRHAGRRGR